MDNLNNIWNFIGQKLEADIPVVLFLVVKSQGSTPGRQGFKMAISYDDSQFGTIGGGAMELKFVRLAHQLLEENISGFSLKIQKHHTYAPKEEQSGLICSGEEWITYGVISPTGEMKAFCKEITQQSEITKILQLNPDKIQLIDNYSQIEDKRYLFTYNSDQDWSFEENLNFKNIIYIFGSGHVGLALSKIFSMLDFYIITIDNRQNVDTVKENSFSNELIIDEYKNAGNYIKEGDSTYIAVVTTSMITDVEVLKSCLHKNVRYIGLMGSKSKRKEIFDRLRNSDISNELLKKIKCPIGIDGIKTNTAEEIAISIASEVIMLKNTFK